MFNRRKTFRPPYPAILWCLAVSAIVGLILLTLLILRAPQKAMAAWYSGGSGTYQYRKAITIDHTKVSGSSSLTNFPFLFSSTDTDLKTTANGGKVTDADGDDIIFTSSDGTTKLDHEKEKYTASSGEYIGWVEVPSISPTADTVIYIYFGNSSITTSQENATGVWDTNYKGVWHLKEDPTTTCSGTKEICDSTLNANHGDANGSMTSGDQVSSKVNGGLDFDGSDDFIDIPDSAAFDIGTGNMTINVWMYLRGVNAAGVVSHTNGTSATDGWWFTCYVDTNQYRCWISMQDTDHHSGVGVFSQSQWVYLTVVKNGTNVIFYKNGSYFNSSDQLKNINNSDGSFKLGKEASFYMSSFFDGVLDEVRFSNTNRSADWIATEYNNQSSPSTFYGLGGAEANSWASGTAGVKLGTARWRTADAGTWDYRKKITIDHTKVSGSGTLTNFPLLFSSTDTDLKTTANGGKVTDADGDDIIFTSSDGTTKLDHEKEKYTATTGEYIGWVEIPILSPATDTTLYIYYGNSSITTSQESATGVWDTNYRAVWHLKENPATTCSGTDEVCDSTSNANHLNMYGSMTSGDQVSGKIDGSLKFDGAGDYMLESAPVTTATNNITLSTWIYWTGSSDFTYVVQNGINGTDGYGINIGNGSCASGTEINVMLGGVTCDVLNSSYNLPTNQWVYLVATRDTTWRLYVNGNLQVTGGTSNPLTPTTYRMLSASDTSPADNTLDEARISSTARSADWIATEYNNQSSPSTFYRMSPASWYSGGSGTYQYRKAITIDHTKVSGSSSLTNFPFLISSTDTDLKTTANGGKVTDADGDDIIFTSSDGTTKLDHEKEKYTASSGEYIGWVEVPSISPTADTTIYIYFGNSSITTSQENINGVWDTNYKGVWHLGEGDSTAAGFYKDSTTNVAHGTLTDINGNSAVATGKVDGAFNFNGDADYISTADSTFDFERTDSFSASGWVKYSTVAGQQILFSKETSTDPYTGWALYADGDLAGRPIVYLSNDYLTNIVEKEGSIVVDDNNWHYIAFTYNGSSLASGVNIYTDGILSNGDVNKDTLSASILTNTNLGIGSNGSGNFNFMPGIIDEPRVSNIARSADWIATEYNNQSSPSTFYGLGGTEANSWASGTAGVKLGTARWRTADAGTWGYRKKITIDHTKVSGSGTLTNFPFLFSSTDTDLKTTANGGKVTDADGDDIIFTSSDGTTKLDHEKEKYTASSGEYVGWVEIPILSPATDTVIYIYYGNSSITTSQENINAVWDTNYKGVWHLKETSGQHQDSTSNNNATSAVDVAVQGSAVGKINGADDFEKDSSDDLQIPHNSSLSITNALTLSYWFNPESVGIWSSIIWKANDQGSNINYYSQLGEDEAVFGYKVSGVYHEIKTSAANLSTGQLYYVVITYDDTADNIDIYVNGTSYSLTVTTGTPETSSLATNTESLQIGTSGPTYGDFLDGILDEIRISSSVRSAGWIATEYNNQSSPSTFYRVSPASWYSGGSGTYQYRKAITIDHTKVSGSSSLTNFPLLISSTDTDLKTTGNGGKVTDADGDDIIFTSSDGTTKLDHEKEKYTASSGEYIGWVEVLSISPTADTTIYIYFGNSSITTSQENATGVWDANYKGVYHLPNGTTLSANDSTLNGNNGIIYGATATTGKANGGGNFDGTDDFIDTNYGTSNAAHTLSLWVKLDTAASSCCRGLLSKNFEDIVNTAEESLWFSPGEGRTIKLNKYFDTTSGEWTIYSTLEVGIWAYLTVTYDYSSAANDPVMYYNGVSQSVTENTAPVGSAYNNPSKTWLFATLNNNTSNPNPEFTDGVIDEVRISSSFRSADWIATEYNNQSSPSTFYGLGGAEAKTRSSSDITVKIR